MAEMRTLTIRRSDQDITVEIQATEPGRWVLTQAIDEDGVSVTLTRLEWAEVQQLAHDGCDETGR